jgi:2-methylaconitate cis-trans-isomerase PrpF
MNRLLSINLRRYSTTVVRRPIPATFLRGGTSKGIFIKRSDLPDDRTQWDQIFRGIMGSPDKEYGRQLNGMGGGVSSLSKICVVGLPSGAHASVDVEYTFVQVGIRDSIIDYSGNCGNLSSMIGVFALDEGICSLPKLFAGSTATVRSFNTNTGKYINTTFPVTACENGYTPILDLDQVSIAGVHGSASLITLDFVSPGGARTGKLLPTGNAVDEVQVVTGDKSLPIRMSLVDATNPTVFVVSADLRHVLALPETSPINFASPPILKMLEFIRQQGAKLMCLDPSTQAQPKIAILSPPLPSDPEVDVVVHALSMGVLHKAVPMTVGLCLGVAADVKGTLPWQIVQHSRASRGGSGAKLVKIRHPSGIVDVGAEFEENGEVKNAKVVRTGRRLMKGVVWW